MAYTHIIWESIEIPHTGGIVGSVTFSYQYSFLNSHYFDEVIFLAIPGKWPVHVIGSTVPIVSVGTAIVIELSRRSVVIDIVREVYGVESTP
jgi:hypothetical protein